MSAMTKGVRMIRLRFTEFLLPGRVLDDAAQADGEADNQAVAIGGQGVGIPRVDAVVIAVQLGTVLAQGRVIVPDQVAESTDHVSVAAPGVDDLRFGVLLGDEGRTQGQGEDEQRLAKFSCHFLHARPPFDFGISVSDQDVKRLLTRTHGCVHGSARQ